VREISSGSRERRAMENRNAAIVRRAVETIWNRGELDLADHLFSAAYVNHGGLIPDLVRGPEAVKISAALFRTAFPALHVTIEDLAADGDTVDIRWSADGHASAVPARERQADAHGKLCGSTLSSLAGGQIVESWTDWDHEKALRRLQVVPLDARA
jgi:SnoaL-like polyketide cyclase